MLALLAVTLERLALGLALALGHTVEEGGCLMLVVVWHMMFVCFRLLCFGGLLAVGYVYESNVSCWICGNANELCEKGSNFFLSNGRKLVCDVSVVV